MGSGLGGQSGASAIVVCVSITANSRTVPVTPARFPHSILYSFAFPLRRCGESVVRCSKVGEGFKRAEEGNGCDAVFALHFNGGWNRRIAIYCRMVGRATPLCATRRIRVARARVRRRLPNWAIKPASNMIMIGLHPCRVIPRPLSVCDRPKWYRVIGPATSLKSGNDALARNCSRTR
jgi:hypothetical protein